MFVGGLLKQRFFKLFVLAFGLPASVSSPLYLCSRHSKEATSSGSSAQTQVFEATTAKLRHSVNIDRITRIQ
jgi:hypothetical protein